jgi:hypothetical protein
MEGVGTRFVEIFKQLARCSELVTRLVDFTNRFVIHPEKSIAIKLTTKMNKLISTSSVADPDPGWVKIRIRDPG